jgi:hypothetical protein
VFLACDQDGGRQVGRRSRTSSGPTRKTRASGAPAVALGDTPPDLRCAGGAGGRVRERAIPLTLTPPIVPRVEIRVPETEPKLVDLVNRLRDEVQFDGRRVL